MTPSKKRALSPLSLILILSGVFFVLFLIISGAMWLRAPKPGHPVSNALFSSGSIGVLELNGVIMDSKRILRQIEELESADSVKGVVIRLNSPGGSVAPSQEIYEAVKRLDRKKPVFSSMQSVAASGAYYVAAGTRKVFANAGTITGSIGVIMEFADLSKLYEWAKVKRYSIKTGKYKDAGADFREMTADERALLQGMIDNVLGQFKRAVMEGRKLKPSELDPIADGRIFSGEQAKGVHLVDELGTFQDAVEALARELKMKGKPSLVYPDKPRRKLLDLILDDASGRDNNDSESSELQESWLARILGRLTGASQLTKTALEPGVYWLWAGGR